MDLCFGLLVSGLLFPVRVVVCGGERDKDSFLYALRGVVPPRPARGSGQGQIIERSEGPDAASDRLAPGVSRQELWGGRPVVLPRGGLQLWRMETLFPYFNP